MTDIRTVKITDSVISDISPDITFGVMSGASQNSFQKFPSTSNSNSALIYNIQVPSENVVVDRSVMMTTALCLKLTINTPNETPDNTLLFEYGVTDALQSFPLNSLFSTVTASINNTTVSINQQDIKDILLKMNDPRKLAKYNSMTPALPDQMWGQFSDSINSNSNPLSTFNNVGLDERLLPRGSHPVVITYDRTSDAGTTALETAVSVVGKAYDQAIYSNGRTNDKITIYINTIVTEPLFLPPFILSESEYNNAGLLGINNMTFNFQIDSSCKRVFSTANKFINRVELNSPNGFKLNTVTGNAVNKIGNLQTATSPALLFRFLSTQPSDLLETKNVIPMLDFPRYLSSFGNNTPIASGGSATITSNNLQINQVPDKFIIVVRKPMTSQTVQDSASFLTINSISINFNNQSGILSSASQYDLWRMSVSAGSYQSWAEFSGQAFVNTFNPATGGINKAGIIPTTGSMLVISPTAQMSLCDYISSGSLGNYNVQFTVNVTNQFNEDISPEIMLVCVNSSLFVTQMGVSSVYQGILTKELVLATKAEQTASPMTTMELARKVGGNLMNSALTGLRGMVKHHRHHRSGAGASGGGASGGGASGGRLSKHY